MRIALIAAAAATLLSATFAAAEPLKVGDLQIDGLWTRATPPRAVAAGGFLTITNTGSAPDTLVGVASPVAAIGELHDMTVEDGIMIMRPVEGGIAIPPGASVDLAPGGLHIMLIDLKAPLKKGEDVPVTLTFEKAGSVEATLHVAPIGAPGPDVSGGGHGAGHGNNGMGHGE